MQYRQSMPRISETRTLIAASSLALLVGCQSDFDRCMETEFPRAEKTFGIPQLASAPMRFRDASDQYFLRNEFFIKYANTVKDVPEPENKPTRPDYPDFDCSDHTGQPDVFLECLNEHDKKKQEYEIQNSQYDADMKIWNQTPEGIAWRADQEAESINAWNAVGVPVNSQAEVDGWFEENYPEDEVDFVLEELEKYAQESDCWGEGIDYCWDPIGAKVRAEFELDYADEGFIAKRTEVGKELVAAVLVKMTDLHAEAVVSANDLAILTCNENGFYE